MRGCGDPRDVDTEAGAEADRADDDEPGPAVDPPLEFAIGITAAGRGHDPCLDTPAPERERARHVARELRLARDDVVAGSPVDRPEHDADAAGRARQERGLVALAAMRCAARSRSRVSVAYIAARPSSPRALSSA